MKHVFATLPLNVDNAIKREAENLSLIFAPIPKIKSSDWKTINGGYLPSDSYKQFTDPENPAYNKKKTEERYPVIKELSPAKSGEANAGFLLASFRKNTFELVLDRPKTLIKITPDASALTYGDASVKFNDVAETKDGQLHLEVKGVGAESVIDLSEIKLPKDQKLTLEISTMHGIPTIILPKQEQNVIISIEAADAKAQIDGKKKNATLNLVGPAGLFKKAVVENAGHENLKIYPNDDKSGLTISLQPPIVGIGKQTQTNVQLLAKLPDGKEKPIELANLVSGFALKDGDVLRREEMVMPVMTYDSKLQETLRAIEPVEMPLKKPEAKKGPVR